MPTEKITGFEKIKFLAKVFHGKLQSSSGKRLSGDELFYFGIAELEASRGGGGVAGGGAGGDDDDSDDDDDENEKKPLPSSSSPSSSKEEKKWFWCWWDSKKEKDQRTREIACMRF